MDKRYSKALNNLIYFFILIVFLVIQSSFFNRFINFFPLLFLLIVIYFSNTRNSYFGIIASFIIGYIYHLHSSSNEIVSNFFPILVFLFSKNISGLFILKKYHAKFLFISSSSFFYFLLIIIWNLYYSKIIVLNFLYRGILSSLILGLIGVFIFNLFEYIDIKTNILSIETVEE
jgi:cell shape-determining protein MreD